jgi:hypothetical protein
MPERALIDLTIGDTEDGSEHTVCLTPAEAVEVARQLLAEAIDALEREDDDD